MGPIKTLPGDLAGRYASWKGTTYASNQARFQQLADIGQSPQALVISCCDSRVHPTEILGAQEGDIFVHRNIASLVPPYATDAAFQGTSAAIEYAVTVLKVAHIIVIGHSACGGVKGCHDMCSGQAPALEDPKSFVGRWVDILRPGYDKVAQIEDEQARVAQLEHEAVLLSLGNLMSFPFVAEAAGTGALSLHGLWIDIGSGALEQYDPSADSFLPI